MIGAIYKVVFDIDDLLCTHEVNTLHDVAFFKKYGAILVAAKKTHYIFPGVKELMRAVFNRSDVEVAFYSGAKAERNVEFVPELLKLSQISPRYKVEVISKLYDTKAEEVARDRALFGVRFSRQAKDLNVFVKEGLPLGNIALVDNGVGVSMPGQVKNQLLVRTTWFSDFREDTQGWDKEGFYPENAYIEFNNHHSIEFVKKEEAIEVSFRTRKTKERKRHVFTEPWAKELAASSLTVIDPMVYSTPLFKAIEEIGGYTKAFAYGMNRTCFIAGMLFSSLDQAKAENRLLTDVFFDKQFYKARDLYERNLYLDEDLDIHLLGLSLLRKENAAFSYMHPHIVAARREIPISDTEKIEFQAYLDNQHSDSVF